jgi:alkylated DNA nucleotide flippase Atl1
LPEVSPFAYGDLGEGGPRQVGWVMSHYGGGATWWRVVRADGSPHEAKARSQAAKA